LLPHSFEIRETLSEEAFTFSIQPLDFVSFLSWIQHEPLREERFETVEITILDLGMLLPVKVAKRVTQWLHDHLLAFADIRSRKKLYVSPSNLELALLASIVLGCNSSTRAGW
jgi:hypothetical protein